MMVPAGAVLSLDSYFNTFYEAYWLEYTDLRRISLRVAGCGRVRAMIYRDTVESGSRLIADQELNLEGSAGSVEVNLLHPSRGMPGRLFAVLQALEDPAIVSGFDWTTDSPGRCAVRLGVGICTFNREDFVERTLRSLLSQPADCVCSITVVNQGQPFITPSLKHLVLGDHARIQVFEQQNFGGAGGFARAALEMLDTGAVTHVLFMDDDVEIVPQHLRTAQSFLSRTCRPIVLGGQMLDLFCPTRMTEAGCRIAPDNTLHANHKDMDLRRPEARSSLGKVQLSTFNGWWFCILPIEAFAAHGLPWPFFIRGDDQEMGARLGRAGIPTVSLPPLSVWHEPFYAAPPGWRLYYDFRNRLIFAGLYPAQFSMDSAFRLFKTLVLMLARFDYQYAHFSVAAIEAFLGDPAPLLDGGANHHAAVLAGYESMKPERVTAPIDPGYIEEPTIGPRRRTRAQMIGTLLRLLSGLPSTSGAGGERLAYNDMPLHLARLGKSYVLTDRQEHFFLRFSYSRQQTWTWLAKAIPLFIRYHRQHQRAAARWRALAQDAVSDRAWRERFAADPTLLKQP